MAADPADYAAPETLDEAEKMEPWPSIPTPSPANTAGAADGVPSSRSAGPATGTVTSTAVPTVSPANAERRRQRNVSAGRSSFLRIHKRGFYFRIRGFGFLVLFTRHPLYGMRHRLNNEHNIGPLWWKILRPKGRVFVSNEITLTIPRNPDLDVCQCPQDAHTGRVGSSSSCPIHGYEDDTPTIKPLEPLDGAKCSCEGSPQLERFGRDPDCPTHGLGRAVRRLPR